MSSEKLGQEAAFPMQQVESGMSKRFYAACAAMQGLLSNPNSNNQKDGSLHTYESLTEMAYIVADELLKQENE